MVMMLRPESHRILCVMSRLVELIEHRLLGSETSSSLTWNVFCKHLDEKIKQFNDEKNRTGSVEGINARDTTIFSDGEFQNCESIVLYQRVEMDIRKQDLFDLCTTHTYIYVQVIFDQPKQRYGIIKDLRVRSLLDMSTPTPAGKIKVHTLDEKLTAEARATKMINHIIDKLKW